MPWQWSRRSKAHKSRQERRQQATERIAFKLYQNRLLLGKPGDEGSDWERASQILRNPFKTALFASHRAWVRLEKRIGEPILAWVNDQAVLSLLGAIGNLGLIIAVVTYIGSEKQRRDAEVLNAWQTITSAYGQAGSGGRIQALEFLNASPGANWRRKFPWFCAPLQLCLWEPESLAGINLTVPGESKERVYLGGINLEGANLGGANLKGANLFNANLKGAWLIAANLEGVDLRSANLEGANLRNTNLYEANLERAKLGGIKLCRTRLPKGINLDPNRDCKELGIDPKTGAVIP